MEYKIDFRFIPQETSGNWFNETAPHATGLLKREKAAAAAGEKSLPPSSSAAKKGLLLLYLPNREPPEAEGRGRANDEDEEEEEKIPGHFFPLLPLSRSDN